MIRCKYLSTIERNSVQFFILYCFAFYVFFGISLPAIGKFPWAVFIHFHVRHSTHWKMVRKLPIGCAHTHELQLSDHHNYVSTFFPCCNHLQ